MLPETTTPKMLFPSIVFDENSCISMSNRNIFEKKMIKVDMKFKCMKKFREKYSNEVIKYFQLIHFGSLILNHS